MPRRRSSHSRACPFCGREVGSLFEEIEHMHAFHQDEIDERMKEAGVTDKDEASPLFGHQRRALGEKRLREHVQHNSILNAMQFFLNLAIQTVPMADYSDEALDALVTDANDLARVAQDWRDWVFDLADDWRKQRKLTEEAKHGE